MKIMLPIDGSPDALAAVHHALALVRAGLQADFVLVNVQEPAKLYEIVTAHDAEVIDHVRADAGADLLRPAEALLQEAGVAWESEVVGGEAESQLVDAVERYGCDAVMIGLHGTGTREGVLAGPVCSAVLRHSPVPVTVVRAPDAEAVYQEAANEG